MSKYIYIEGDTNDADYIALLSKISDEKLNKVMPLIVAIKNCKEHHNFPDSYYNGENPKDLYPEISQEIFDLFYDYVPHGEDGVHTITEISIIDGVKTTLL